MTTRHPAKFSEPVIDAIERLLIEHNFHGTILDPFAGVGGVHRLSRRQPSWKTVGLEIEPEWALQHKLRGTVVGDALTPPFAPETFDAIVTSPCYGNRMADHHDAKDSSKRNTYKHVLGRDLHANNAGQLQWGSEYREFHTLAWNAILKLLKPDGLFILNVSDHIRKGARQPVSAYHIRALSACCFLEDMVTVPTRRLREGANRDVRVDCEYVFLFEKWSS